MQERFSRTFGSLINQRFTGVLRLSDAGRPYAVYWDDGAIVFAESSSPEDQVGRVAAEAKLVDAAALSDSLRRLANSPGRTQMDILVQMGALDGESGPKLSRLILTRRSLRVFALPSASWTVSAEKHGKKEGGPVEPRWTLYHGLRHGYDERRLGDELGDLANHAVRLAADAGSILDLFGFADEERVLTGYLAKGYWELHDLAEACLTLPRQVVLAGVAALRAVEALDVQPAAKVPRLRKRMRETTLPLRGGPRAMQFPGPPPTSPPPPPPPATPTAVLPTREQIMAKLAQVDAQVDHFVLLGVARDATGAQIKQAYMSLVWTYHSDRLALAGLESMKPQVDRILARLNEAQSVLANDVRRREYLTVLSQGGEQAVKKRSDVESAKARKLVDAEKRFLEGEMHLRRQAWAPAIECFRAAVELNGDEAEHHALLAWARWCAAGDKQAVFREVKDGLDKAVKLNDKCVPALLYLGQVHSARGEVDRAYGYFQRVLAVDASHIEARREVRLIDMRRSKK